MFRSGPLAAALACVAVVLLAAGAPVRGQTPDPPGVTAARSKAAPQLLGRIEFTGNTAVLPAEAQALLDTIVSQLPSIERDRRRIQIAAFASGAADREPVSASRRLSLQRALIVREQLIGRGVAADRIDVRALGSTRVGDASLDRVDVLLGTLEIPADPERARK